jgi:very-short-patch-repair endonuclease
MAVSQLCEKIRLARDVSAYGKLLSKLSSTDSLPELSEIDYKLTELITDVGQQYIAAWTICLPARLDDVGRRSLSRYRAALMELSNTGLGHREIAKLFRQIETNFPKISEYLPCWCVANLSLRGRIPFVPGFFDVVIIDEASQCDIASALPLLFRAKKAVIIGDPNQLQHITTMSRAQDAELKRKHGLLELENLDFGYRENSLFALAQGFAGKESVIQLKDHHRSHADIIDFSNRHFYEGTLRIATDYRKLKRDGGKCGIKWFNVEGKVFRPSEGGAVNELEAKAVVAETLSLIRERRYTGTIGITTPFRAQANRIRDYLQNELDTGEHDRHEIIVDVVHKFQGDERDCVFFSPVVSDNTPDTAIWFLRSTGNLFNVAITRARAILNVIGDIEACGKCGVDYLAKFAQYCAARTTSTEVNACGGQFESPWEKVLYDALVKIGLHPIPQYVVNQYRLDLALKVGNNWLDIEVDGERYHREWNGELSRRDVIRNQRLAEQGWKPLRFWVYEIRDDLPKCVERVKHAIS